MYLGGVGVQGVCLGVGVGVCVQGECVYLGGVGVLGVGVGVCVQGECVYLGVWVSKGSVSGVEVCVQE